MGSYHDLPLVDIQKGIENGHENSLFTLENGDFP